MPAVSKALPSSRAVNRAQFTTGRILRREPEYVAEREVPTSSYAGGEVQHSTLKIREDAQQSAAGDRVIPLTKAVYNSLPPNLQKMTLFGKVVIVTGYAPPILILTWDNLANARFLL